jgi:hypothetical protein
MIKLLLLAIVLFGAVSLAREAVKAARRRRHRV